MRYYHPLPTAIENRLCEILGLSKTEAGVLSFTRKANMSLASISFLMTAPRTSVADAIKRLTVRNLLIQIGNDHKNTRWRSNLPVIFREIQTMRLPRPTDWINESELDENI